MYFLRCTRIFMSDSLCVVSSSQSPRRRYPVEYKRQVVQESMSAGASIARVALAHGINANQLHNWIWQYRRGDFGPISQGPFMLPVRSEESRVGKEGGSACSSRWCLSH